MSHPWPLGQKCSGGSGYYYIPGISRTSSRRWFEESLRLGRQWREAANHHDLDHHSKVVAAVVAASLVAVLVGAA